MSAGRVQAGAVTSVGALFGWLVAGPVGAALGAAASLLVAIPYGRAITQCRPYERNARGVALCVLDATWGAINTWAGALFLVALSRRGNRVETDRSVGSGTVFLCDQAIAGYATTIGIVKAGCAPRLARHEQIHVFQARLLGPLYLPLVGLGFVVATLVPYWLVTPSGRRRSVVGFATYFTRGVYPNTWHEWWAYRRG